MKIKTIKNLDMVFILKINMKIKTIKNPDMVSILKANIKIKTIKIVKIKQINN